MKYIDMHCDALTACADGNLAKFSGQVSFAKLHGAGCLAQCFAIFTEGGDAPSAFDRGLNSYFKALNELQAEISPVLTFRDFAKCEKSGKAGSILTVENLSFIGDDLDKISFLKASGVRMASLVWNTRNLLAAPNLIFEDGFPQFEKRESAGLSPLGRQAVEKLDEEKIIIDISHLSDGGADEILTGRKIPAVASHSNAQKVRNVSRNLTDELIKKLADCGGVTGVNFCKDFLGENGFESVLAHILHIIKAGGEDVIAIGSDFDGIPVNEQIAGCERMPALFEYLLSNGLPPRVVEKFAYKNFSRVFKEVCG